jgi:GT2 family glycosyltransferase
MDEKLIKVAVVIPVYNRRETTLQGLKSLSRVDTSGIDLKIYVVDDASPDGTAAAVAEKYPEVVLIHGDGSLHYAAGTNRGIEAALGWKPDFIATMNDDSIFHEQFLQRLIATARDRPRSIVGALLLLWDEPHRVFQVGFEWDTFSGGWRQPATDSAFDFPKEPFEVEGMAGNCVLFPVAAIEECGLMDEEKFPHGWGDIQYLVRMRKKGWRLLVDPKAYVWCEPNTYPKPLHQLPVREILKVLFKNQRHPLNLQRQFIARWESAPNRAKACTAFSVYLFSLLGKIFKLGRA